MEEIKRFYELYYNDIYKYIYSLTFDTYQTEDIIQSTFLSAIKSIQNFKGLSSVKTWLISIARHEYFNYLRKHKSNSDLSELTTVSYDESRDCYLTVVNEIQKLDQPQKEITILRLINDLSFAEIALILNLKESYCRVSFFRAKQKLMEVLSDD